MSARFTPGPWFVFDHYFGRDPATAGDEYARTRLIGLGQFNTIAEVRQGSDEVPGDVDANARLIAAAPDLLAACSDWLAWLDSDDRREDAADYEKAVLDAMRAAIAKAVGQ